MPIISKPYQAAYRGVMSSSELNAWMADLYADLSELFARISSHDQAIPAQNALWLIQHAYLRAEIESLRAQLQALQDPSPDKLHYAGVDQWATAEAVEGFPACAVDTDLGIITASVESETSKLYVRDLTGEIRVPKSLAYRLYEMQGEATEAQFASTPPDSAWGPNLDPADLLKALDGRSETAFFRAPSSSGSALSVLLEITLPTNVVSHRKLNKVALYPAPSFAYDWAYAGASADSGASFSWLDRVVGGNGSWVPDAVKTGPFALFVPERIATHLRIGLKVKRYITSGTARLFPYGFRHLEASYVRFHEGESRLRLTIPKPPGAVTWKLTQDPIPDFHPGAEALAGQVDFQLHHNGVEITPGTDIGGDLQLTLILRVESNQSPVLRGVKFYYQTT